MVKNNRSISIPLLATGAIALGALALSTVDLRRDVEEAARSVRAWEASSIELERYISTVAPLYQSLEEIDQGYALARNAHQALGDNCTADNIGYDIFEEEVVPNLEESDKIVAEALKKDREELTETYITKSVEDINNHQTIAYGALARIMESVGECIGQRSLEEYPPGEEENWATNSLTDSPFIMPLDYFLLDEYPPSAREDSTGRFAHWPFDSYEEAARELAESNVQTIERPGGGQLIIPDTLLLPYDSEFGNYWPRWPQKDNSN